MSPARRRRSNILGARFGGACTFMAGPRIRRARATQAAISAELGVDDVALAAVAKGPDRNAGLDKAGGDLGVCGGGSHDAGRMNAGQQLRGQFGKIGDTKLLSDFPGLIWRAIKDALENYVIKLGVNASVVFPKVPDSDHENPNGLVFSRSSG